MELYSRETFNFIFFIFIYFCGSYLPFWVIFHLIFLFLFLARTPDSFQTDDADTGAKTSDVLHMFLCTNVNILGLTQDAISLMSMSLPWELQWKLLPASGMQIILCFWLR